MGEHVKATTWNVKGLNTYMKRKKVLAYLKQRKSDIILLQETHLLGKDTFRMNTPWVGEAYHNTYKSKRRGVAILFAKGLQIQGSMMSPRRSIGRARYGALGRPETEPTQSPALKRAKIRKWPPRSR